MPSLFPIMSEAECFRPGDCVRKFVSETSVTPFVGLVSHVVPATQKVWVQWPTETASESPETLIRVNPLFFGFPSPRRDHGYDSWEKQLSERMYGAIPKRVMAMEKMALRIAHGFATNVVGRLVDDIEACRMKGLKDIQAYNRIYHKYANICSDYIMRFAIQKVYADQGEV